MTTATRAPSRRPAQAEWEWHVDGCGECLMGARCDVAIALDRAAYREDGQTYGWEPDPREWRAV